MMRAQLMTLALLGALVVTGIAVRPSVAGADEVPKAEKHTESPSEIFARRSPPMDVINYLRRSTDPRMQPDPKEGASPLKPIEVIYAVVENSEFGPEHVRALLDVSAKIAATRMPTDELKFESFSRMILLIANGVTKAHPNGMPILLKLSELVTERFDQKFQSWKTLTSKERKTMGAILGMSVYKFGAQQRNRVLEFYKVASREEFANFMTHLTTLSLGAHLSGYYIPFTRAFLTSSKEMNDARKVYMANETIEEMIAKPSSRRLYAHDIEILSTMFSTTLESGSKAYVQAALNALEKLTPQALSPDRFQTNLHELFLDSKFVIALRGVKERFPSLNEQVDAIRESSSTIEQRATARPGDRLESLVRDHAKANADAGTRLRGLQCKSLFGPQT